MTALQPTKKVIIRITFNAHSFSAKAHLRLTAPWIRSRLDIFWQYTLQSLKAQTNQDFEVFIDCAADAELVPSTFLAEREPLPANIHFNCGWDTDIALSNLAKQYDMLYLTRLDSDDLYEKTFVDRLYHFRPQPATQAIVCQNGYLYITRNHTLKTYFDPSPPFYTFIYTSSDYLQGKRYQLDPNLGHASVITHLNYEILTGSNYMVTVHGTNTGTTENSCYAKELLSASEAALILPNFGLKALS